MIAYIVTSGSYSDYGIEAVFSTREKAETYIKNCHRGSGADIEEWTMDEKAEMVKRTVYRCRMPDGAQWKFEMEANPDLRTPPSQDNFCVPIGSVWGDSFISPKHARKVAVEAWQARLREKGQPG